MSDPSEPTTPVQPSAAEEPIEAEIVEEPRQVTPAVPVAPAVPAAPPTAPDYDEHGVPSFDHVRDKIENRYATSIGTTELTAETPEGRSVEQQEAERAKAAAARLEEIRRSLRD